MLQHPNPTFRQLLEDLFLSDYTFEEIWDILQDEPARPIRDWPDGGSMGFAIPSPGPAFTPAPAPAPAATPAPAPAPVTAGGAGVGEGKMDEACMAEESDDLWGGIVTWISAIPFRYHPANHLKRWSYSAS